MVNVFLLVVRINKPMESKHDELQMSKLQMIKRANSTVSYSVNLPLAMIRDIDWKKGDIISFRKLDGKILIFKDEDENGGD